jgi:hypothetical protein
MRSATAGTETRAATHRVRDVGRRPADLLQAESRRQPAGAAR